MQENVIRVVVKDRTLTAPDYIKPTRYSVDHDFVEFVFAENSEWAELTKHVTFYNDFVSVSQIPYADKLKVPAEVLRYKSFRVTIEGSEGDTDRLLTATMGSPIHVDESGKNDGDAPVSPSKTLLTKLTELYNDLVEKVRTGYFNGQPGKDGHTPVITASKSGSITTVYADGVQIAQVADGEPGQPGTPGSDASATDVQINGTSIVVDGVANIPKADGATWGITRPFGGDNYQYGITVDSGGMYIRSATNDHINSRNQNYRPIVPSTLDYAVTASLTDGKSPAWTDAQKLAARERFGLGEAYLVEEIAITQDTSRIERTNKPDGTPYKFDAVKIVITGVFKKNSSIYIKINDDAASQVPTTTSTNITYWYECNRGLSRMSAAGGINDSAICQLTTVIGASRVNNQSVNKITLVPLGTFTDGSSVKIYAIDK